MPPKYEPTGGIRNDGDLETQEEKDIFDKFADEYKESRKGPSDSNLEEGDYKELMRLKLKFGDQKETSILFEKIMLHYFKDWFGDDVIAVYRSCEYDDYSNNSDIIIEFTSPNGVAVLSVDLSVASDIQTIETKITKIVDNIKAGRLGSLKYFFNSVLEGFFRKKHIPQVVVGYSPEKVEEMCSNIVKLNYDLKSHSIQINFLKQISSQLNFEIVTLDTFWKRKKISFIEDYNESKKRLIEMRDMIVNVINKKEKSQDQGGQGIVEDSVYEDGVTQYLRSTDSLVDSYTS